jgi:small Trp-rich protein
MPLVIVGVLLLLAKLAEFGPTAHWSWWIVLAPFAAAAAWWQFADSSGLTMRREMDKMEKRKLDRRDKAMEALGMDTRRNKQVTRARQDSARALGESADPTQAQTPLDPPRRDPRL